MVRNGRGIAQVQSRPDAPTVGLDDLENQIQAFGDRGGFYPLTDETKNLQLAIDERSQRRTRNFLEVGD